MVFMVRHQCMVLVWKRTSRIEMAMIPVTQTRWFYSIRTCVQINFHTHRYVSGRKLKPIGFAGLQGYALKIYPYPQTYERS